MGMPGMPPGMGMPGMMPGMPMGMDPMMGGMPGMMPGMMPPMGMDPMMVGMTLGMPPPPVGCVPPTCGGDIALTPAGTPPPASVDVTYIYSRNMPPAVMGTALNIPPPATTIAGVGTQPAGAPQLDFGIDPVSGMAWGRWQPNWVNSDPALGTMPTSLHYFTAPTQTVAINLPITGTFNYIRVGNTTPTDNLGNQGTLNSATFSANFTAHTVTAAVDVTVAGNTLNGSGSGNIIGAGFNIPTPTVTCTTGNCGPHAGSVIGGQFSGPNGVGAGVGYGLVNGQQVVNGVAVFRR